MITALDTNVLLDLLVPGSRYGEAAQRALDAALTEGGLVVCEIVYAELASQFPSAEDLDRFLAETRIRLEPSTPEALRHTSQAWRQYLSRRGTAFVCPKCGNQETLSCTRCGEAVAPRQHILSDFLVGGHALAQADRLLTRDRGFYRTYFPTLRITSPD